MSQENENNKPQIKMTGVSGNKELRVRRVHKRLLHLLKMQHRKRKQQQLR